MGPGPYPPERTWDTLPSLWTDNYLLKHYLAATSMAVSLKYFYNMFLPLKEMT